jgi:DNA-binding GntR family transcriptional regulator
MLSDVIAELRGRIITQRLAPGSRLRERQLAEDLGVSRAVIREALSNLAERRLVVRFPNRGAEVVRLGREDILSIYETRGALEGLCARLATERAPPGHWNDLVELFGLPAQEAVRLAAFDTYTGFIDRLNVRMIAAAHNTVLEDLMRALEDRSAVLARRSVFLPGRAEQGLVMHRAVVQAMQQGDPEKAERLKRENLMLARDYLLRFEEYVL